MGVVAGVFSPSPIGVVTQTESKTRRSGFVGLYGVMVLLCAAGGSLDDIVAAGETGAGLGAEGAAG